jgi:hypothetical protein
MKFVLGIAVGYVLGSRAGRERYEDIVAMARRVAGSQTVQATAGVLQAQAAEVAGRAKSRLGGGVVSTGTDSRAADHPQMPLRI